MGERKIAVITPVSHLEGIVELLISKGKIFLHEESTKDQIRQLLLTHGIDTILCNPNQQTYKIDNTIINRIIKN